MPPNSVRAEPSSRSRAPLVIASSNPGKLREFRELLAGLPYAPEGQTSFGVVAPEETGSSFYENALLKARHAAQVTGFAAIADDSGLEVDALHGAPGVFSARYAGLGADDAANNAKLIAALSGVPTAARRARYRCVLVFVHGPDDPSPITAEGTWEGRIVSEARGSNGFGYDPYFYLDELGRTAAQLEPADKNLRSHRGIALRALRGSLTALP